MTNARSVDDLAQLGFASACDEVQEIMGGEGHLYLTDMTACEMVALLTILRPARERKRLAQRQPAAVLKLVALGHARRVLGSNLSPRPATCCPGGGPIAFQSLSEASKCR
jgi:hypothetical protein